MSTLCNYKDNLNRASSIRQKSIKEHLFLIFFFNLFETVTFEQHFNIDNWIFILPNVRTVHTDGLNSVFQLTKWNFPYPMILPLPSRIFPAAISWVLFLYCSSKTSHCFVNEWTDQMYVIGIVEINPRMLCFRPIINHKAIYIHTWKRFS